MRDGLVGNAVDGENGTDRAVAAEGIEKAETAPRPSVRKLVEEFEIYRYNLYKEKYINNDID